MSNYKLKDLIPVGKIKPDKPEKVMLVDKEAKKNCPLKRFLTQEDYKAACPYKGLAPMFKAYIFKHQFITFIDEAWIAKALMQKYPSIDMVDKKMKSFDFKDDLESEGVFALKNIWQQHHYAISRETSDASFPPPSKKALLKEIRLFREGGVIPISYEELLQVREAKKRDTKAKNKELAAKANLAKREKQKKAKEAEVKDAVV